MRKLLLITSTLFLGACASSPESISFASFNKSVAKTISHHFPSVSKLATLQFCMDISESSTASNWQCQTINTRITNGKDVFYFDSSNNSREQSKITVKLQYNELTVSARYHTGFTENDISVPTYKEAQITIPNFDDIKTYLTVPNDKNKIVLFSYSRTNEKEHTDILNEEIDYMKFIAANCQLERDFINKSSIVRSNKIICE